MPDFLIIGAQKCGTTSLYVYLSRHPQIIPASQKEIHFFDLNYDRGIDWYLSKFPAKINPQRWRSEGGEAILTGESSPYYLFHPSVPQRVKQLFPDIKLIVLLRDPVERTWSHYHHEVRLGFETLPFEAAINSEGERLAGEMEKLRGDRNYYSYNHQHYTYLSRGRYIEQLKAWMELFPREQFLILNSEEFYANPSATLSQTLTFLGLSPCNLEEYQRFNIGDNPPMSDKLREKLINYFSPYNQQLFDDLQVNWNWSSVKNKMEPKKQEGVDYEGAWDKYAGAWQTLHPGLEHIGDEWTGKGAGAAKSLAEYSALIERQFIQPYIDKDDLVLEVGIGGGKTSKLLQKYCGELICADISSQMLEATRSRLGDEGISYIKLDGLSLAGIAPKSVDVCFCYDTMVHIEPRDIFNYLNQIPPLMRGKRLCLFHHTNILGELGWQKFLTEWDTNLMGQRHGCAFSVMTDNIMEQFLTHLNYEIILKDTQSVPRDCIWVCKAPLLS